MTLQFTSVTIDKKNDSSIIQSDLDHLQKWDHTCNMEFNPSKYQVLYIRQPIHFQYSLHVEIL